VATCFTLCKGRLRQCCKCQPGTYAATLPVGSHPSACSSSSNTHHALAPTAALHIGMSRGATTLQHSSSWASTSLGRHAASRHAASRADMPPADAQLTLCFLNLEAAPNSLPSLPARTEAMRSSLSLRFLWRPAGGSTAGVSIRVVVEQGVVKGQVCSSPRRALGGREAQLPPAGLPPRHSL
jgi:hypothetical protein